MLIRKIKKGITHQGIGGKEFIVDVDITRTLNPDKVFEMGISGNIACYNFLNRRKDFNSSFPFKLYYGKVDGLGYIVSEDELEK